MLLPSLVNEKYDQGKRMAFFSLCQLVRSTLRQWTALFPNIIQRRWGGVGQTDEMGAYQLVDYNNRYSILAESQIHDTTATKSVPSSMSDVSLNGQK